MQTGVGELVKVRLKIAKMQTVAKNYVARARVLKRSGHITAVRSILGNTRVMKQFSHTS